MCLHCAVYLVRVGIPLPLLPSKYRSIKDDSIRNNSVGCAISHFYWSLLNRISLGFDSKIDHKKSMGSFEIRRLGYRQAVPCILQ